MSHKKCFSHVKKYLKLCFAEHNAALVSATGSKDDAQSDEISWTAADNRPCPLCFLFRVPI